MKTLFLTLLFCSSALAQPLGTFTKGSSTTNFCPTRAECWNFTVSAPAMIDVTGEIAIRTPVGSIQAVDTFFSLEAGNGWWGGMPNPGSPITAKFFNDLLAIGHQLVFVRFNGSWYAQQPAAKLGPLVCAIRPATVMQWVKDNYPAPKFNVIGTSNGAAAIAYALADYGITVNTAVIDSGPPEMEIANGCENVTGYAYDANGKRMIDLMYGYSSGGPCSQSDASFQPQWDSGSVESNGTFYYSGTTIHIISGANDNDFIRNRSLDYLNLLSSWGQTAMLHPVLGMGHGAMGNQVGLDIILSALSGGSPTPTPQPTPSATCVCP